MYTFMYIYVQLRSTDLIVNKKDLMWDFKNVVES